MKRKFLKIASILFVFFLGIVSVNAASFSVGVGSKNLSKGNTTKLTIRGSDVTGRFNIKSSNSSVVSISEDRAWIENDSYSITLTALSVGTSTITITPSGVSDGSGNAVNLGSKTITITVALPRQKSTDNTLKSLSVENFEITPNFDKNVTDYSVSVPEGTKEIDILASANSGYAKITGNGKNNVTEGVNNLSVTVTSESGVKKVYNLTVNVIDENPITITVENKNYTLVKLRDNFPCPTSFENSETVIENTTIPTCTNNKINYVLVGLKDESGKIESFIYKDNKYSKYLEVTGEPLQIIVLDLDTTMIDLKNNENNNTLFAKSYAYEDAVKIKINGEEYNAFKYGNSNRLFLVYGINVKTGEKNFYLYDNVNNTYSLYEMKDNNLNESVDLYKYLCILFAIGFVLALSGMIYLNGKNRILKNNNKSEKIKDENKSETVKEEKLEKVIEEIKEEYNILDEKPKKRKKNM